MFKKKMVAAALAFIGYSTAFAWEVDTHSWIGLRAFERSNLNPNGPSGDILTKRLGFDRFEPQAAFRSSGLAATGTGPSDKYFDLEGNWDQSAANPPIPVIANRFPSDWEYSRFPEGYRLGANPGALGPTPQLRLEAWYMRGIVREDDLDTSEFVDPPIPDADPYGDITRVFGHFYDPVHNQGIPIVGQGEVKNRSINWALGLDDALGPYNPTISRRNHFTWLDARRAYLKALTYQTTNATLSPQADEFESEVRLFFLATMMKSLGQVSHVLQDGAQPQHSRLDGHNHSNNFFLAFFNKDLPRRLLEVYTNIRVTGDINLAAEEDIEPLRKMFTDVTGNMALPPLVPVGTYPVPQFAKPVSFFTTRTQGGSDAINDRKGLFDYSNRGFFTDGTANGSTNLVFQSLPSPPPNNVGATTIVVTEDGKISRDLAWIAPDAVAPNYVDALDPAYMGKVPLGKRNFASAISNRPVRVKIEARHLRNHANVLIPRAISYSAGLINYFFRGTLEIEPIEQKIFAVANQGEAHTVDANGWPRKAGGAVFGFEKIRLKVRNITTPITEPGVGGAAVPQTVGNDGQLVAIARYHRNLCYQPDLSGERTQTFATPPLLAGVITEPTCAAGATRSIVQDISVSVPMAITGPADLPGGTGTVPAGLEKTFDFAIDPIPINATDLIIQVVYRGTLGEEPESIALGALDVREPTIVTFWNNTDYYFDGGAAPWQPASASYPFRQIQYFRFCIGPSTAERLGYWFAPPFAGNAMTGNTNAVRVAVIAPAPTAANDFIRFKATPVTTVGLPPGPMQPLIRTSVGRIAQANREFITDVTQAAPVATCNTALPGTAQYWCNDPLQRRRGFLLGAPLQPVAWASALASGFNTGDAGEFMPAVASSTPQALGEVRFNDLGTLANCPATPIARAADENEVRINELEEVARSFGLKL
jgi:hypothetical protein